MDKAERDHDLPNDVVKSFAEKSPPSNQEEIFRQLNEQFEQRLSEPNSLLSRVMRQKLEDARRNPTGNGLFDDEVAKAMQRLEDITKITSADADAIEREYRKLSMPSTTPKK